jgi:hypothetical protein
MERGMRIISYVQFFVLKAITSAVKWVEFVSDRMLYIILRDRGFHINVLGVHAPTEVKADDAEDSCYEKFPKYHMKIILGDFNVQVAREDAFIQTIADEIYTKLVMIIKLD